MIRHSPPAFRPCLARSALLALGLIALPAAAGTRTFVGAELKIESGLFVNGLGAAKADVEKLAGEWLAAELEKTLAYVDWVGGAALPPPAYALVVRLIERPDTGCGRRIDLAFALRNPKNPGALIDLPAVLDSKLTDECNVDIPTRDPAQLLALLQEALGRHLGNSAFRQLLEDQLLHRVPLATSLPVRNRAITVPFRPEDVGADLASELRATFKVSGNDEEGVIDLALARPATWGTVCRVERFSYPGFSIPSPEVPMAIEEHPRFAVILDPAHLLAVSVYMTSFRQGERVLTTGSAGLPAEP